MNEREDTPTQPIPRAGGAATVGKFTLLREIGRGAYGIVWEAQDGVLDRHVAIKTIRPEMLRSEDRADFEKRFLREARAVARLSHPGIVTIHEAGQDGGTSYIAMELVSGRSLRAVLAERGKLPAGEVLKMGASLCEALHAAHAQGILHRDVKPENLLLREDGQLKVADFGVAKALHVDTSTITREGTVTGTPSYMSPEQIRGQTLDGRSDLFSVGAVMYEALTGKKPFGADAIASVVYKILHESPPPPHELDPAIPVGLSDAVMRAVAKDPAQRFQSCASMRAALLGEETPTQAIPIARSPTPPEGTAAAATVAVAPPAGPSPRLVLLVALLAVLTVAALSWTVGRRGQREPAGAVAAPTGDLSPRERELLEKLAQTDARAQELLQKLKEREERERAAPLPATPREPTVEDHVRKVLDGFTGAAAARDAGGVVALLDRSAELHLESGSVLRDLDVIRDVLERQFADPETPPLLGRLVALPGAIGVKGNEATARLTLPEPGPGRPEFKVKLLYGGAGWRVTRVERLDDVETADGQMLVERLVAFGEALREGPVRARTYLTEDAVVEEGGTTYEGTFVDSVLQKSLGKMPLQRPESLKFTGSVAGSGPPGLRPSPTGSGLELPKKDVAETFLTFDDGTVGLIYQARLRRQSGLWLVQRLRFVETRLGRQVAKAIGDVGKALRTRGDGALAKVLPPDFELDVGRRHLSGEEAIAAMRQLPNIDWWPAGATMDRRPDGRVVVFLNRFAQDGTPLPCCNAELEPVPGGFTVRAFHAEGP